MVFQSEAMDTGTRNMKVQLLFFVGVPSMLILVAVAFAHRLISPRGLGVVIFALYVAVFATVVFVCKKSAGESGLGSVSIDTPTRKVLVRRMWMAKMMIVLMTVSLIAAIVSFASSKEFREGPIVPLLVGLVMNLLITASSVRTVMRLQKLLS